MRKRAPTAVPHPRRLAPAQSTFSWRSSMNTLFAGIAAGLITMGLVQGETMTVDCSGDICVSR